MKFKILMIILMIMLLFLSGCNALNISKTQACNLPDEQSCNHQNFLLIKLCNSEYDNESNFVRCVPKE